MPCRAASICRQAASTPSQCLWITDDILADAWLRFARVSNATRERQLGRRYGSNVPGPLEARRRAAKRRMGMAATTGAGSVPGLDFGALFGLGGHSQDFKVGEYKYQPPGPQPQKTKAKSKPFLPFLSGDEWRETPQWEQFLEDPEQEEQEDPVETSKDDFAKLLAEHDHLDKIEIAHAEEMVKFLLSSADEPAAGNLVTLEQWLSTRDVTDDAMSALRDLVMEKVVLRSVDTEATAAIIVSWLANARRPPAHTTSLLDSLSPHDTFLSAVCKSVTQQVCESTDVDGNISTNLSDWLRSLRDCAHLQGWHSSNQIWQSIYVILAAHLPKPSALVQHFAVLTQADRTLDLARVLLQHWVPFLLVESRITDSPQITTIGGTHRRFSWATPEHAKLAYLTNFFEHVRTTRAGPADYLDTSIPKHERIRASTSPLVDLLAVLHHHGIPSAEFSMEVFSLTMANRHPGAVYTMFRQMSWINHFDIHEDLALFLIEFFRQKRRLDCAMTVFHNAPTISVTRCPELANDLAHGGADASVMFELLGRRTRDNIVPLAERRVRHRNTMTPAHVRIVHKVAYNYAESPNTTSALAFRRVWQCYIFLQDHGAELLPLLTRALTISGIIRPFKELKRPSSMKVRYILSLVARVEGKEIAEQLDRELQNIWINDVLPQIQSAQRAQRAAESWRSSETSIVALLEVARIEQRSYKKSGVISNRRKKQRPAAAVKARFESFDLAHRQNVDQLFAEERTNRNQDSSPRPYEPFADIPASSDASWREDGIVSDEPPAQRGGWALDSTGNNDMSDNPYQAAVRAAESLEIMEPQEWNPDYQMEHTDSTDSISGTLDHRDVPPGSGTEDLRPMNAGSGYQPFTLAAEAHDGSTESTLETPSSPDQTVISIEQQPNGGERQAHVGSKSETKVNAAPDQVVVVTEQFTHTTAVSSVALKSDETPLTSTSQPRRPQDSKSTFSHYKNRVPLTESELAIPWSQQAMKHLDLGRAPRSDEIERPPESSAGKSEAEEHAVLESPVIAIPSLKLKSDDSTSQNQPNEFDRQVHVGSESEAKADQAVVITEQPAETLNSNDSTSNTAIPQDSRSIISYTAGRVPLTERAIPWSKRELRAMARKKKAGLRYDESRSKVEDHAVSTESTVIRVPPEPVVGLGLFFKQLRYGSLEQALGKERLGRRSEVKSGPLASVAPADHKGPPTEHKRVSEESPKPQRRFNPAQQLLDIFGDGQSEAKSDAAKEPEASAAPPVEKGFPGNKSLKSDVSAKPQPRSNTAQQLLDLFK